MPLSIRKRPGSPFWFARGTVPARQPDGTIQKVRIERSTRTQSKTRAREIASDFERYYHELAYNPKPKSISFAEAALTYIQTRGKSDRFVTKLIKFFGTTPIADIDQAALTKAADALYPNASASTRNRAVFTPASAITSIAGRKLPDMRRPAGHDERPVLRIPPDSWFDAVLPKCPPKLAALLVFLTLRGRRVGEAIRLKPQDVDWESYEVIIERTKTGVPVKVTLPSLCVEYLKAPRPKGYTGPRSKHLFGYHSVAAAHVALKTVCKNHGLPMYGFHSLGRHAFATRLLKAGWSVKHIQEAGGWKSSRVVADRYLHLSKSEVAEDVDIIGEEWSRSRAGRPKAVENQGEAE